MPEGLDCQVVVLHTAHLVVFLRTRTQDAHSLSSFHLLYYSQTKEFQKYEESGAAAAGDRGDRIVNAGWRLLYVGAPPTRYQRRFGFDRETVGRFQRGALRNPGKLRRQS